MNNDYILTKEVDWSVLKEGFTLPIYAHDVVGKVDGQLLKPGERKPINLIFNREILEAKLTNSNFSREKFGERSPIIQIRYGKAVSSKLKEIFKVTNDYIVATREENVTSKRVVVPDEYKAYIVLYETDKEDTYKVESIVKNDIDEYRESIKELDEETLEKILDSHDSTATIVERNQNVKIRRMNKRIGSYLKKLYQCDCQICGANVGKEFDIDVCEVHHIEYYSKSMNNDPENILILCPNHHRLIHKLNPLFDKDQLEYIFPNGKELKVEINKHLYVK